MKLVYLPHDGGITTFCLEFNRGSWTDKERNSSGLAHLMEHSLFLGTKNQDKDTLSKINASLGKFNAFTSTDIVAVYASLPSLNLRDVAKQYGEMLTNCTFPEDRFIKEKEVICKEITNYKSSTYGAIEFIYEDKIFQRNVNILGTKTSVKKAKVEDIQYAYDRLSSKDAILYIAGGKESDAKWTRDYFSKKLKDKKHVGKKNDLEMSASPWKIKRKIDVDKVTYSAFWTMPRSSSKDRKTAFREHMVTCLVSDVIGLDESCYLFKHIRDGLGAAYSVFAHPFIIGKKTEAIRVFVDTTPDMIDSVHEEITQHMVENAFIRDEDLEEFRNKVEYDFLLKTQTSEQFLGRAMGYVREWGTPLFSLREEIDIMRSISADEINEKIQNLFSQKPYITIAGNID